jgi:2-dehydropantoate 2-reductase
VYTVVGAGSVGSLLGGFLHAAGIPVRLVGRSDHMEAIARDGLRLEGDAEELEIRGIDTGGPDEGTILLCLHAPQAIALAPRFAGRSVVAFQNGVGTEPALARHARVIGAVWRMTSTLVRPGLVRFTRRGRVIVGRHPSGVDGEVDALARDLSRAGFEAVVSGTILADKWLKLLTNLVSPLHAIVRKEDHARPAFGELKARILREARDVLRARGIEARSCDGKDPSVDALVEAQARPAPRARPVCNSTWRQLSLGRRPPERFHETIAALALEAGMRAPLHEAFERLLDRAPAPECFTLEETLCALG